MWAIDDQKNPPLRDKRHWEAAWAAVRDGSVDTIGSDHAPHARSAKEKPWPICAAGRLSLPYMVDLMSAGPARVYGAINKGRLAAGYDADFTLVDTKRQRRIEESWIVSPCGWTPFAGKMCTGWPMATIVRGRVVMREDVVAGEAGGRLISFRS